METKYVGAIEEVMGHFHVSAREIQEWKRSGAPLEAPPYDVASIAAWLENPMNKETLRRAKVVGILDDEKITLREVASALPHVSISVYIAAITTALSLLYIAFSLGGEVKPSSPAPSRPTVADSVPTVGGGAPGSGSDSIRVAKSVHYYKLLRFSDRRAGGTPLTRRFVGYPEHQLGQVMDLYDEARVSNLYFLHDSSAHSFRFDSRSSGATYVTPIMPSKMEFGDGEKDDYETGRFKSIEVGLPLDDDGDERRTVVMVDAYYVNGYQVVETRLSDDETRQDYASDGSVTLNYSTDEAYMIFDFSSLDYQGLLADEPTPTLLRKKAVVKEIEHSYGNGVLRVGPLKDLLPGDRVFCDWTWATESD